MKAQIVEGWPKGNKIRIILSETNAAQVNGLRRAILSDVPKMAITKVRFEQGVTQDNKGEVIESVNVLPDEVIAHRLAMVPVPTFLDEFVFPEDLSICSAKDQIERTRRMRWGSKPQTYA